MIIAVCFAYWVVAVLALFFITTTASKYDMPINWYSFCLALAWPLTLVLFAHWYHVEGREILTALRRRRREHNALMQLGMTLKSHVQRFVYRPINDGSVIELCCLMNDGETLTVQGSTAREVLELAIDHAVKKQAESEAP